MKRIRLVWAMVFACLPPLSYAAQWTVDAGIYQELGYNDNVRMTENGQGSFWYKVTPVINFAHRTDVSNIVASASYGMQRYPEVTELNRDLQDYHLTADYKTERSTWKLTAGLNIAPNFNTASMYSGNFSSNSQMQVFTVSPAVSYRLTELDDLKLNANYSERTFTGNDFSNNQSQSVRIDWQHQWTKRLSHSLGSSYLHFDSVLQSTDSYSVHLGTHYRLSESWEIRTDVGGRFTNFSTQTSLGSVKGQSAGYLLDVVLEYKGEKLFSQLGVNRSLIPTNQGSLQEQDKIDWSLKYLLSEQLSASLNANYLRNNRLADAISNQDVSREFISVQPALNWQITPEWTLTASYAYRKQQMTSNQSDGFGSGTANLFMLTINYNWQGLSLSR